MRKYVEILAAPLVVAGYGFYILNQGMMGWEGLIAGIAFTIAAFSAIISLVLYHFVTKGQSWHGKTIPNLLTGAASVGIALGLITLLARTG